MNLAPNKIQQFMARFTGALLKLTIASGAKLALALNPSTS